MTSPYITNSSNTLSCDLGPTQIMWGIIIVLVVFLIFQYMKCLCNNTQGTESFVKNVVSNFTSKPKLFTGNENNLIRNQIDNRPGHENPMDYDYTLRSQLGEFNGKQRERLINIDKVENIPDQTTSSHKPSMSENDLMNKL